MRFLKRLVFLAILVAIGYGAQWLWQSPFFSLYRIQQGLAQHDAVTVERYVDLERMVQSAASVVGALAKERVGVNGDDVGSKVLGGIISAIAGKVGEAASVSGAMEVRRAIQEGNMKAAIGPFTVDDGVTAISDIDFVSSTTALVELNGTCGGHQGKLRVSFEKKDGPTFGWPKKWVLVGIDASSLPALARACRAAP